MFCLPKAALLPLSAVVGQSFVHSMAHGQTQPAANALEPASVPRINVLELVAARNSHHDLTVDEGESG